MPVSYGSMLRIPPTTTTTTTTTTTITTSNNNRSPLICLADFLAVEILVQCFQEIRDEI